GRGGGGTGGGAVTAARNVAAIVQKEWKHYFGSPIAWVVLFVWTLLFGVFFYLSFSFFVQRSAMGGHMEMGGAPPMSLNDWVVGPVFQNMAVVALFLAPMLTMRLFAEEKRQGTMELLATAPITDLQIVLGKFVAAVGVFALMLLAGFVNLLVLWHYASSGPEWRPVLLGALAVLLCGASFMGLGLFFSTLTRNQIVAATLTFCLALVMWVLGWIDDPTSGPLTQALAYLGVTNHLEPMVRGVLDLKDLVFYLSVIAFGLFLTHQAVQTQRWRA
ncbi:MAG TPA: ABC transporter permease, partial [Vicinamibacteria bacterium]|nr:ABC transporter permease [Vicinamibacteria bacterium]